MKKSPSRLAKDRKVRATSTWAPPRLRRRACPSRPTQFYTDYAGRRHVATKKGPGKGLKVALGRLHRTRAAAWRAGRPARRAAREER